MGIAAYLILAFVLCWLAYFPLWWGADLSGQGLLTIFGGVAMLAPAIAAFVIVQVMDDRARGAFPESHIGAKRRPSRRRQIPTPSSSQL